MVDFIRHNFVSAKADSADSTLVSSSEWNDGHIIDGGINGQVLIYDNTQPNNMRWADGARGYTAIIAIPNGTTSPQPNFLTIAFTSNSPVVLNYSVYFNAFATGAASSGFATYVDGAPSIGLTFVPDGTVFTQYRTLIIGAGSHLIDLDMETTGNVTWIAGLIYIAASTHGV